ncbi:MAG TPA: OmpA family protein [Terriglobia bacterium]|nr:OmpA family protein [Terriglobia bacterium]
MHTKSRQFTILGVCALSGMLIISGCATKKYVREQTGAIDTKLTGVSGKLTEVETRTRENAERIDGVDKRAQQGITDAATANKAAATADGKATQAQTSATAAQTTATSAQQTATTANQGVAAANTRITTVENRINNMDRYTAESTQSVTFRINSSTLNDAAKSTLDGIANQVSTVQSGYMIEIQGFASSDGDEGYNVTLSERRAEAVQRYLVSKNVPLFRISIVGLGTEKPVGDNKTRAGREQNRRVEVRLLRASAK